MNPSGEQVELAFGEQRAVLVSVGAGLRTYSVGERPILDGYGAGEVCPSGRGQLLVPWPNRIEDGRYDFEGRSLQLPLNEPARRNAIHGLVRWSHWAVVDRAADRVAFEHVLYPQPGYPFALELRAEYSLSDDGLAARVEATNVGSGDRARSARAGTRTSPSRATWSTESSCTCRRRPCWWPTSAACRRAAAAVADEGLDFREPRPIGQARLDHCFTDLERDDRGRAAARVGRTTVWVDESFPYLMVFTGDGLPDVERRSVAVEPMTCAPNAFRSGEGLIRLEPGQAHAGRWGISPG